MGLMGVPLGAAVALFTALGGCVLSAATTVRLGLSIPSVTDPATCRQSLEMLAGVLNFTARLNARLGAGTSVEVVALNASTPMDAWSSAQAFMADQAPCPGAPVGSCDTVHGGILGPPSSTGTEFVQLVMEQRRAPLMAYSATAPALALGSGGTERNPIPTQFLRFCQDDDAASAGVWEAIDHFRWDVIVALYEQDSPAAIGQLEALQRRERDALAASERGEGASAARDGIPAAIVASIPFDVSKKGSLTEALEAVRETGVRIIVLAATDSGAAAALRAAIDAGMMGKGWTWVGERPLRPAAWRASDDAAYDAAIRRLTAVGEAPVTAGGRDRVRRSIALQPRLEGMLGVIPGGAAGVDAAGAGVAAGKAAAAAQRRGDPVGAAEARAAGSTADGAGTSVGAVLIPATFLPAGAGPAPYPASAASAYPPPDPMACPAVAECAVQSPRADGGCLVPRAGIELPALEDAVSAVAQAVRELVRGGSVASEVRTSTGIGPGSAACPSLVARTAAAGVACPALLAPAVRLIGTLTALGDWPSAAASDREIRPVPRFREGGDRLDVPLQLVQVQPAGRVVALAEWVPSGDAAGSWAFSGRTPVWPGFEAGTPTDRVTQAELVGPAIFVVFALGVTASVFLAHSAHKIGLSSIPESAVAIGIGAAVGGIISLTGDPAAVRAARFDEEVFALVFLPIIISESGLVLQKHPFFSQLFSILTFALVGTLVATLTVGGALFWLGSVGAVLELTIEEALSFAALISAVDPVATLAVFSSKRVDPMLNALVYGEAVINDAVAIVLFTTASSFIARPVTGASIVAAVGSFFVIMAGSLAVGVAFGLVTTLLFRCVRPLSPLPASADEADVEAITKGGATGPAAELGADGAGADEDEAEDEDDASDGGDDVGAAAGHIELVPTSPAGGHPDAKDEEAGTAKRAAEPSGRPAPHRTASQHDQAMQSLVTGLAATAVGERAPRPPPGSCRERFAVTDPLGVTQAGTVLLMAYGSFAAAEALGLSGIVSSLFAGITMNHWLTRALSPEGRRATQSVFRALASLAETAVFFLIGTNAVLYSGVFDGRLVAATIILCLAARLLSVFPLACLLNRFRKRPIPTGYMTMMWIAGLRGAIAYATSLRFPTQHREEIVSATSWVVIFTIVVLGTASGPALRCLGVPVGDEAEDASSRAATRRMNKEAQRESCLKRSLATVDRSCLRPCLYAPEVLASRASQRGPEAQAVPAGRKQTPSVRSRPAASAAAAASD